YNDINLLKEQINNTYKEKLESLEKKIDLLVDENKALRLAYSTREVEDNAFKDEILNLIKESMSTIDKNYIEVQSDDIENLKKLAKKGDIHASFKLGQDYYYGNNINKNVDLAVKYYKIGAKCNHSQSIKELMKIYTDEATNGNIKYQRILGMEYLKGSFIDVNIEEAIKWLTAASENGSLEAKNKLNKIKTEYNK
ncbi:MAG: Sel1 protein, partial [Intestinibacter bartlettii DORA_8_9]